MRFTIVCLAAIFTLACGCGTRITSQPAAQEADKSDSGRQIAESSTPAIGEVIHRKSGDVLHVSVTVDLTAEVEAVLLHYSTKPGQTPRVASMFDDGRHHDKDANDGIFGGSIAALEPGQNVRYHIEARFAEETMFLPASPETEAFEYRAIQPSAKSSVVINEFMAANDKVAKDPQGDYDDWIELYNKGDSEVDLSGMFLSDSSGALRKWSFPKGTIVPAGGYLIVWADEDGKDKGGLHANFKLSKGGEELYLTDTDERGNFVIDHVKFGKQVGKVSFGRAPDGTGPWQPLTPTIGKPNQPDERTRD